MAKVFAKIREVEADKPEFKTEFRPGDRIQVISGAFEDSEGTVVEVKPDLDVIRANLSIFGREAPVDLGLSQVLLLESGAELKKPKKRGRKPKNALESESVEETMDILGRDADEPEHPVEVAATAMKTSAVPESSSGGTGKDRQRSERKSTAKKEAAKDVLDFLDDDSGFEEAMTY